MPNNPINIVVLLRETCDPRPPAQLTADGYGVQERGLRRIANPMDICALEQALTFADKQNGTVTAVAIGPQRLDDHLRLALSMGVQRCIRVWDSAFIGGDTIAAARLVERLLEILQPDYFMTGNRLLDSGADPAPMLASAKLGMPSVTAALKVEAVAGKVTVLRKCDRGARQRVDTSTPCSLLFEDGSCEVRYPDQVMLMAALTKGIETWGVADLGLPYSELGGYGSVLTKDRCSFPRANPKRIVTPDANLPAFERILALLSGGIKPRAGKLHCVSAQQTADQLFNIFQEEGLFSGSGQ